MENSELLDSSSTMDTSILLFCFMSVLQMQLSEFLNTWNLRHVRKSSKSPGGKPEILFAMPELVGAVNKGIPVTKSDIQIANENFKIESMPVTNNETFFELYLCYVHLNNMTLPNSPDDALEMHIKIKDSLRNDGFHAQDYIN